MAGADRGDRPAPWRPTPDQLEGARQHLLPDVIATGLDVLFCGINPSLYSTAVGHHFARPGNRFWPTLHRAGFTDVQLSPFDDAELLPLGFGVTNLCPRTTARADELSPDELRDGARALRAKIARFRPRFLAVVGFTAYRAAFERPHAEAGPQPESLGDSTVWLLPNPSGLNAHHSIADLASLYGDLAQAVEAAPRRRSAPAGPPISAPVRRPRR